MQQGTDTVREIGHGPRLIVYGDIALDVTIHAGSAPQAGQDATDTHISLLPGGSAANCAAVAARLGTTVELIAVTGSDQPAQMLVDDMRQNRVGIRHLRQTAGPTAIVAVLVHPGGERTFYSFRGATTTVPYGPLPDDCLRPGDRLHLSGYSFQDEQSRKTALTLIEAASKVGIPISLDPSFHSAEDFRAKQRPILAAVDVIFPNELEARRMTGLDDPQRAAVTISEWGPRIVAVKLGGGGCFLRAEGREQFVPGYAALRVLDTTGAGDAFCAGFLTGLLHGMTPRDCARLGHAVAVCVIAERGGHEGAPTLAETVHFMKQREEIDMISALALAGLDPEKQDDYLQGGAL